MRAVIADARQRLTDLRTPEQINRFIADFVCTDGRRLIAHPDGSVTLENKATPANAEVAMVDIAGGGFEPPTSGL